MMLWQTKIDQQILDNNFLTNKNDRMNNEYPDGDPWNSFRI